MTALNPSQLAATYMVLVFAITGVLDYLYREVPPELWILFFPLGVALGASYSVEACGPHVFMVFLAFSLVLPLASLVLYIVGLIGGADVIAYTLVALTLPCPFQGLPGLPPILDILLMSLLLGFAYAIYSIVRACYSCNCCVVKFPRVLVPASRLLRDERFRWWIPRGVGVEEVEDYEYVLAEMGDELVEASPGIPHLTLLAVAIIAYTAGLHPLEAFAGLLGSGLGLLMVWF